MWEITLIGEKQDYIHFLMLEELLKERLNYSPIIAISEKYNQLYCSIALKNRKNLKIVKKSIIEIIIKICKEEYLREKLTYLRKDENLNNFIIMSLVIIGIEDEIEYSLIKIKFSKIIHIRSLLKFRLNKLYDIWERLIVYLKLIIKDNSHDDLYLDFLKFLAKSSSKKSDILYLIEQNENIKILDKNRSEILSLPKSDEIGVVVNLIICSPRKLIINCYNIFSKNIINLIEYIFQDRVSILL